ncbi:hypothetical protein ACCUM_2610 [Candidatus Accumulibacter phosphatis]|uniref:Uncharacterized protein n=1 Tax=Candidatus Accumulibacter phosphatis TaxID=327160 RepID=A0A5S4ER57_9PROT|nr:hypothetical protein [Accumulibacter sp.]TMQ77892.1 hypothetical protein ACCUM_2610 [Candidatus Accumulibacter phosphatis]
MGNQGNPFYSRVTDDIDAVRCKNMTTCSPMSGNAKTTKQFVVLQYANQSAELYGIDISPARCLWRRPASASSACVVCSGTFIGKNRETGEGPVQAHAAQCEAGPEAPHWGLG